MKILISIGLILFTACTESSKPYPKYKYGDCVATLSKNPFWRPKYDHLVFKLHDYNHNDSGVVIYQGSISLDQARKYSFHADLSFRVPEDEIINTIECGRWE